MFEFMNESWTMPTTDMMYTRSQNYINEMVHKHGIQTFIIMIVVFLFFFLLGASMVKWTTLDPCLVFSDSDSKASTNFEFCEEKFTDITKTY